MEQSEFIKLLINQGDRFVRERDLEKMKREIIEESKRKESWEILSEKAKISVGKLYPPLVDFLELEHTFTSPTGQAPDSLESFLGFFFDIENLAPIYVRFGHEGCVKGFFVPEVGYYEDDDEYYWYGGLNINLQVGGSKSVLTHKLPLALSYAKRNFEIYQRLTKELEEKKAAEAQQKNGPVYETIPESVDQEFMNSFRQVLADVVHKIACEG